MILHPRLERCHYHPIHDPVGLVNAQTYTVYEHDTAAERSEDCTGSHPRYAILSCLNHTTKSSRLFFEASDLDSDFRKIRCLDYRSSLKWAVASDLLKRMDTEGGPERQAWKEGENLELPMGDHGGRYLDALTVLWYILCHELVIRETKIEYRIHSYDIYGSTHSLGSSLLRRHIEDCTYQKHVKTIFLHEIRTSSSNVVEYDGRENSESSAPSTSPG